jgi:VIT1/CCC1 family predicted Fe2+/Mn2+ transporter
MSRLHTETHSVHRIGWLRAAVLGANDGLVSTASLIVGVAAAAGQVGDILVAGIAGLVAGAMSMAAGEYVSVSSQADTEAADLAREKAELRTQPDFELAELAGFFEARGIAPDTAQDVARQLTEKDALGAHAREELGISDMTAARPLTAAVTSAATFVLGAALPLLVVLVAPFPVLIPWIAVSTLAFLALLGALGARAGGAPVAKGVLRVTFWGAVALAVTAGIGSLFGAVV